MLLYHGTSAKNLPSIRKHGLEPRGERKSEWDVESDPNSVYLTDAYALHFASNAVGSTKSALAIIEVDTDKLDQLALMPDEDFLEAATRSNPEFAHIGKDMKERTYYFRDNGIFYAQYWKDSMKGLGNCRYGDTVPVSAITRIATIARKSPIIFASDPTITMLNYRVMGGYYRALMRHVFGDSFDTDSIGFAEQFNPSRYPRDGITVTDYRNEAAA